MEKILKIILLYLAINVPLVIAVSFVSVPVIGPYWTSGALLLIQYIVLLWLCRRFLGWDCKQTVWGAVTGVLIGVPLLYCIGNFSLDLLFEILPGEWAIGPGSGPGVLLLAVIVFFVLPLDLLGVWMCQIVGRLCKK